METETMELGNLCPEAIDCIFSRIPLKNLVRLKCVSKAWSNFIKLFRHYSPPKTSSGLIVFLQHKEEDNQDDVVHESRFIEVQDQSRGRGLCSTTYAHLKHDFPLDLIDSCNGLLLYATNNGDSWTYYVCGPSLDQCLALPCAHKITSPACASLAFDGSRNVKFRVISFFWEEFYAIEGIANCMIFSSETWQWRFREARILNSNLLLEVGFDHGRCFRPSVFCGGRLYWIWSLCMLVFDIETECFNLIPLPLSDHRNEQLASKLMLSQLLWKSDGHIYFCHPIKDGISIFAYIGDEEDFNRDEHIGDYSTAWRLWRFSGFLTLKERTSRIVLINGKAQKLSLSCRFRPCVFNEDLQLLYLFVPPGSIFSYSFETQELVRVWSCIESGGNSSIRKIFCFSFKSVDLFLRARNAAEIVSQVTT